MNITQVWQLLHKWWRIVRYPFFTLHGTQSLPCQSLDRQDILIMNPVSLFSNVLFLFAQDAHETQCKVTKTGGI